MKAIAIFAVIVIHSCNLPADAAAATSAVVIRQLVNFAVPLFFGLSGLMVGMSKRPKDSHYVMQRLGAIWPAYLFWTVVFIALFHRDHLHAPGQIILDVFAGLGIGIGYFVISLTQMIIITPLIARIKSINLHFAIILILSAAGKLFTYTAAFGPESIKLEFPYSALPFVVWYPFFHLGYLFSSRRDISSRNPRVIFAGIGLALVGLLASMMEGLWALKIEPTFSVSQLKLSSSLFSLGIFTAAVFAYPAISNWIPQWLAWIGRSSYFIYLFHLIPLKLFSGIALKIGLGIGTTLSIAFVAVLTFIVCWLAASIGRKVVPVAIQRYLFG